MLSPEDIIGFVKSKAEVDVSERAFNLIVDVIGANADKFDTEFHDFAGYAYWGRCKPDGVVIINKTVLEQELEKNGFDFAALKKKWAEAGHLVKNSQGRYYGLYTLNRTRANYVALYVKC